MNIQAKLVGMMAAMLLILVVLMVAIGTGVINTIIYELNTELLSLTLAGHIESIESTVNVLEDSGATGIAAYVQQAQREVLQQFQTDTAEKRENFYVIAPQDKRALFQSHMSQEQEDTGVFLSDNAVQTMMENKSGTLSYDFEGIRYFTVYRYFEKWDWLIGASLPETTMFEQRKDYLVTVGWTSLFLFIVLLTVAFWVGRKLIVTPVVTISTVAKAIATGNFDQTIAIRQRDEIGALAEAVRTMQTTIQQVLQDSQGLLQAIQQGKLSTRGEMEGYTGSWRDLIGGVNNVIDAFVDPITVTATALARISKGDIPDKITADYQGDFNTTKHNLNELIDTMAQITGLAEEISAGNLTVEVSQRSEHDRLMGALRKMIARLTEVLQTVNTLVQAIRLGKLDVRGGTETMAGGWYDLVTGLNEVVDAFVEPITTAATTIDQVAKGSIPAKLTGEYQGDFNTLKDNLNVLIDSMNDITDLAQEMSDGNLTVILRERSEQDTLMQALNAMIEHLQSVVTDVQKTAGTIAIVSNELSSSSEQLSNGASEQAASMEESSSSMEEMAANIRQNADNARQTEKIALQSAEYAEEAGRVVAETVIAMQQIAQKIAIVEDIANQTRMLSLNATIEAARAQDHGKAFSVVASEVRQLSDTTKTAAEEIGQLATASLDISEKAGTMLAKLVPSIRKTTELIQEISAASNEQSTGAGQINRAIQQADQITQQNATIAEETAASAEELSNQARQLQDTIAFFMLEESFQASEPKVNRQKKMSRSNTSKTLKKRAGNTRNTEETESEPDDGLKEIPPETGDDYDDEFERY